MKSRMGKILGDVPLIITFATGIGLFYLLVNPRDPLWSAVGGYVAVVGWCFIVGLQKELEKIKAGFPNRYYYSPEEQAADRKTTMAGRVAHVLILSGLEALVPSFILSLWAFGLVFVYLLIFR